MKPVYRVINEIYGTCNIRNIFSKMKKAVTCLVILFCFNARHVLAQIPANFPDGFLFGVASAAYQIEGAWNESGKGESIWDRFVHDDPSRILNGDNGDIACDSYNKYREDVAIAAGLGVKFYRFSISWPRILPTGNFNETNPLGIAYYQNLIDEIISYNMTAMATLYHWDLPQQLEQDFGGFRNVSLIEYFVNYSRIAFQNFPKVGYWVTFNEPRLVCNMGYGLGTFAPGVADSGRSDYQCAYVILKAHAETYHTYKTEFSNYTAKIGLVLDGQWSEPATNSTEDVEAAERRLQFEVGLYGHPIFKGNWPDLVIQRIANRSTNENLAESRLPQFTAEEIQRINGTVDYLGFNSYFSYLVSDIPEANYSIISQDNDVRSIQSADPTWSLASNNRPIVPWGFRKMLQWLKTNYEVQAIFVTENGMADNGTSLEDDERITYYTDHLRALLQAIYEDGINILGYTAWSLMDNFEWTSGYSQKFGLFSVDFNSTNRTRTPKKSARFYTQVATTLQLPAASENGTESDSGTGQEATTEQSEIDGNYSEKSATFYLPLLMFICFTFFTF